MYYHTFTVHHKGNTDHSSTVYPETSEPSDHQGKRGNNSNDSVPLVDQDQSGQDNDTSPGLDSSAYVGIGIVISLIVVGTISGLVVWYLKTTKRCVLLHLMKMFMGSDKRAVRKECIFIGC